MFDSSPARPNLPVRKNVAIVGSGIAGLGAAWALSESCNVKVFEAASRIGGHTNTVLVEEASRQVPVDTGFIVFNEPNYPNLTALFERLGVAAHDTDMHFSVSARDRDLEYASSGLRGLFADLRNLTRPRFFSMIADILRFHATAPALAGSDSDQSLGEFLRERKYGRAFIEDHLVPMAAAIWSCPVSTMLDFPARSLARFFINHGLAELSTPFEWRSVKGGSASYLAPLTQPFAGNIHTGCAVVAVTRETEGGVRLRFADGSEDRFDEVVLACHGPQAFGLLKDADESEMTILSKFRTQRNRAVLHRDARLMPRRRNAWASWNYLSARAGETDISVTYWMNELQHLDTDTDYFVTLNPLEEPSDKALIAEFDYDHPVFDGPAMTAQRDIWSIQGQGNVWYAGAWLGYGFHEDGLQAGLAVAEMMTGWQRPWAFDYSAERLSRPETFRPRQEEVA